MLQNLKIIFLGRQDWKIPLFLFFPSQIGSPSLGVASPHGKPKKIHQFNAPHKIHWLIYQPFKLLLLKYPVFLVAMHGRYYLRRFSTSLILFLLSSLYPSVYHSNHLTGLELKLHFLHPTLYTPHNPLPPISYGFYTNITAHIILHVTKYTGCPKRQTKSRHHGIGQNM